MHLFSRLRLRTKLASLLFLSVIGIAATAIIGTTTLRTRMVNDRLDKYRAVVETTAELARALESRAAAEEISREQALALFRDEIHAIRFDNGLGYMSVVDTRSGRIVIHGANRALENADPPTDKLTGTSIPRLVIDAVGSADRGTVTYMYPRPGETTPLRKLVAISSFHPWNMVVYAGAYTDDLDAEFRAELLRLGVFGGGIVMVIVAVTWALNRDIVGALGRLKTVMQRLAQGEPIDVVPGIERRDEVGEMAATVEVFKIHAADRARLEAAQRQQAETAAQEKRGALVRMADTIEHETETALQQIAGRTSAMTATAEGMSTSATRTRAAVGSASIAAQQALARTPWRARPRNSRARSARSGPRCSNRPRW